MKLPNSLSLSIIAGLQLIVSQNFPDLWWSPVALAALVAIGKLLQVNSSKPASTARSLSPDGASVQEQSKLRQFLVG